MKRATKAFPSGGFYAIQPLPTVPGHIKLGYSSNFQNRLKQYYTLCPDARIVRSWHCWSDAEREALALVEKSGFKRIGTEVFQVNDLDRLFSLLDEFFLLQGKRHVKSWSRWFWEPDEKIEAAAKKIQEAHNQKALAWNKAEEGFTSAAQKQHDATYARLQEEVKALRRERDRFKARLVKSEKEKQQLEQDYQHAAGRVAFLENTEEVKEILAFARAKYTKCQTCGLFNTKYKPG